jgi:hypothetical protein
MPSASLIGCNCQSLSCILVLPGFVVFGRLIAAPRSYSARASWISIPMSRSFSRAARAAASESTGPSLPKSTAASP